MPKKVVTLGEIMLRLSPPGYQRFVQTESFDATYGGGEANVAAALCNYGLNASFVSKVPATPIGQAAINHLRRYGVDTQFVARGGKRLGIYFMESGASIRASQVIYDRADSSISEADIADFDFDKLFEGADWFHTSGITPAISDKAAALTEAALMEAKARGITTSIDLNYRKKLWTKEKAREVMTSLCRYVDVCIGEYCGDEEAQTLLGFKSTHKNRLEHERYRDIFGQMKERYNFKYMASTFRNSISASENELSAIVYNGNEFYTTQQYKIQIIDSIGGGDSFTSGLIFGLISEMEMSEAAEFGVAACAFKHTIPGDFNQATVSEIQDIIKGGSARVQR